MASSTTSNKRQATINKQQSTNNKRQATSNKRQATSKNPGTVAGMAVGNWIVCFRDANGAHAADDNNTPAEANEKLLCNLKTSAQQKQYRNISSVCVPRPRLCHQGGAREGVKRLHPCTPALPSPLICLEFRCECRSRRSTYKAL